jgi:hypothetical protein
MALEAAKHIPAEGKIDTFRREYIFEPAGINKYTNLTFKKITFTNFDCNDPEDKTGFLCLTGNGPLPCVKTAYLYQVYLYTDYVPALTGDNLGDGFYSVKVK